MDYGKKIAWQQFVINASYPQLILTLGMISGLLITPD